MNKYTIDKEITDLESKIDTINDISQDYLGEDLRNLMFRVFLMHSSIERGLENIILDKIKKDNLGEFHSQTLENILENTGFMEKLTRIQEFDKSIPFDSFLKINKYRNEFAHKKHLDLTQEYIKDKNKKRGLLRILEKGNDDLQKYCIKKYPDIFKKNKRS